TRPPAPGSAGSAAGSARWGRSTSSGAGGLAGGIGVFQTMQGRIDSPGERLVHALDLGDLLDPGRPQARQAAEMAQQGGAAARADAGDVFEAAGGTRLLAPAAMAGDGEAVGLVADLLDELQAQRGGARPQLAAVGQQQAL